MKRWMKVLLLTLLAGMVIAGLGSVLPVRAADGEVILYRVNAGGNQVNATDGGPNWARDSASYPHQYNTSIGTTTDNIPQRRSLGGPLQGAAPDDVYRSYRTWRQTSSRLSYSFPVTPGRTYRINLYFVDPRDDDDYEYDNRDRVFDVQVNGSVPSAFNNITLARIRQGPRWSYRVPVMVTAEVTMPSNDSTLDLVWVRDGTGPRPVVSGIEIIELVPQDTTPPTVSITSPANGELVSGTVQITATASDNVGVTEVEFYCGTSSLGKGTLSGGVWQLNWNTTTLADGTCVLTAKARDAATNEGTSAAVNVTIDNTAPTVSITSPTGGYVQGTVQITATASDTNGVKQVEFFVDGTSIGVDTNGADGWSVDWDTSEGLDGEHTLKAVATDTAGNSAEHSITVTVDNSRPDVSFITPVNLQTVAGMVSIKASASDPHSGITSVEFWVDGVLQYTDTDSTDGWTWTWDASALENGDYILGLTAVNGAGLTNNTSIQVVVDNGPPPDTTPPTVSITSPADGATVNPPVTITANATDPSGVSSVAFYANGAEITSGTVSASGDVWTLSGWNPADGVYTLTAVATDNAGNSTTSASVTITVVTPDTTAPTVSITSPAAGSTVAGVTTIIASATDDGTVTRVEFFVDGTSIGADENGADGWSVDWDTTGDVDGWYVLTAKATDDSNNTGESDGVGVLVDNIPTVLEIVRPTSGAPVSGQVEIALSGSPDLMWVEVYLDGEYLDKATLVDGVWTLLWDTTAFEDGVYTLTAYGMTELEQDIESQAMQVTVQNTETPPDDDDDDDEPTPPEDEPTPTVPDVLPAMLCDLDDGSLNAHHCGRPVAIFRSGDELHLYGIDINTGNGSLALLVTAADIESAGVPEDVPVLIAVGENPYTHRPIALYRLPGGEFQLNTAYWDGKEYIVKWQPGAAHVEVIYW